MAEVGGTQERGSVSRDREILCALFDATDKAKQGQRSDKAKEGQRSALRVNILQNGWKRKDGWKSSEPVGEWYGVTTNKEGRVIGLQLEKNDLAGILPPQLGGLDALEEISLQVNWLQGSIPAELGNLGALVNLYLYGNQLTGSIPTELGNLGALVNLYLHDNQLTGSIPAELGNLGGLVELWLYGNQLTGSIPAELGNLGALVNLYLHGNQLTELSTGMRYEYCFPLTFQAFLRTAVHLDK